MTMDDEFNEFKAKVLARLDRLEEAVVAIYERRECDSISAEMSVEIYTEGRPTLYVPRLQERIAAIKALL